MENTRAIILSGHIDTVKANENDYRTNPFKATIIGENIYGLGIIDMKCFFASIIDNLSKLTKLSKQEKNKEIISYFEKLGKDGSVDKKAIDEMITKLMKGGSKPKANKILGFARGLNSIPGVITTFLISPYLLGWFIPRLTYANTRRLHEKAEKEKAQKINTAA